MTTPQKALKHLKKVWVAVYLLVLVITCNVPVYAQDKQTLKYDVYAGGFHVVNAELLIDTKNKNAYTLELSAGTQGFLRKLAPWDGVFRTKGFGQKTVIPQTHEAITTWRGEKETKKYQFDKKGNFQNIRVWDDENNGEPKTADKKLTAGTVDMLTATFKVLAAVKDTKKCQGQSSVFDGRRRFNLVFHHVKNVELKKNDYNVYEGSAAECTVEVKPAGGDWHVKPRGWMSIQEQGRAKGTMPTLWVAQISDKGAAVPVKIRVKTEHGTLFMHLVGYDNGVKTLKLNP